MMPTLVASMDLPVALDHKVGFTAIKVSDVIAKLMLPSELESREPTVTQVLP